MQNEHTPNGPANNSGYEAAVGTSDQQKAVITSALQELASQRALTKGGKNAVSNNMKAVIERLAYSNPFFKDVHENPPHARTKLYVDIKNQVQWFTQQLNDYCKNRQTNQPPLVNKTRRQKKLQESETKSDEDDEEIGQKSNADQRSPDSFGATTHYFDMQRIKMQQPGASSGK